MKFLIDMPVAARLGALARPKDTTPFTVSQQTVGRMSVPQSAIGQCDNGGMRFRFSALRSLAPMPETPVDRAIREEGERLRKAFPWLDEELNRS